MRLSDREWKTFIIGDLFSVKRPIARNKDHYENGNVPFVASGSGNNGVMKCCKPHKNEELDNAGCITVSPVDGSAFYQPYDFFGTRWSWFINFNVVCRQYKFIQWSVYCKDDCEYLCM